MKLKISTRLAGSLLLVGALALSGGCGYKNNPVPPQTVVPKAITDLRYSLDGNGAKLTWSYPIETISGKDIEEITSFDLYRAEIPLKDFCSDCPIPFGNPFELPGGAVGTETRKTGEHVSGMLRSGNKYFFKMQSRTSWLAASSDSNIISFVYHTPASAPQNVKISIGDRRVSLSWDAVTALVNGEKADLPLSYQVLKSQDGKQYAPVGGLLSATSFVDSNVESGNSYYYKVQSGMSYEGEKVGGSESKAVMAKVTDVVPPGVVSGVTVVASTSNVRIFWDSVDASDLAGYRIYKRAEGQSAPVSVGEVGPNQTIFIDKKVVEGKVYYSVAAFDVDGNEGDKSEEATTRH